MSGMKGAFLEMITPEMEIDANIDSLVNWEQNIKYLVKNVQKPQR